MRTKHVTWSSQHNCTPGDYSTVVCYDRVAIVLMTENLPLVQIFDGEGNRTDCEQYQNMAEVGEALAKALKGEKLTMTQDFDKKLPPCEQPCHKCGNRNPTRNWRFRGSEMPHPLGDPQTEAMLADGSIREVIYNQCQCGWWWETPVLVRVSETGPRC